MTATNAYAVDGKCHNAQPGTFNHECGKPATWIGRKASGFTSGYCDQCKADGYEARDVTEWQRPDPTARHFAWHADPGHAWLEVSLLDLAAVGVTLDQISRYSYRDREWLYLEEDRDAGVFIDAYQRRFDHSPAIWESAVDGGWIRYRLPVHHEAHRR